MVSRKRFIIGLAVFLASIVGCNMPGEGGRVIRLLRGASDETAILLPSPTAADPSAEDPQPTNEPVSTEPGGSHAPTVSPVPTATEDRFSLGEEITIEYLRELHISGSQITFEEELASASNYHRHLVSYISEGNRIYGLLTIPFAAAPETGYKAIVFNHGYIAPTLYQTTERYSAYVDYLARSGFVVFKIDYRGHGQSEGEPTGSYFSPGYTIDSIAALKSLQTLDIVDPQGIGMWGHSMAGNLVLRAMLVEPDIQAGVIWAGAVYSYDDFTEYGIQDNTYRPPPTPEESDRPRRSREIIERYGRPNTQLDYWRAVSLTENIEFLDSPLQIHHSQDDPVVTIRYSEDLAAVLEAHGKEYEFHTYAGGGHNLISPYFGQAMMRTVEFFRKHL